MVMTTSASLTASAAEGAAVQPPSDAFATASATRSNAWTSCPALARFGAIPPPMWPRPMNAILAIPTPCSPAKAGVQSRTKERREAPPGPRPSPGNSLPALPLPRPLLDKGGHAFFLVLGAEQAVEQASLETDTGAKRKFERGVDHFLGRHRGQRRHG